jgi:hypothetical protein
MRILAVISGDYGARHVENIRARGPKEWQIESWDAPTILPLIIDYPEDYLPETMPAADLILALAEHKGVAELLPEIATLTGAKSVIAPVDNEAWLPRGLARQLRGWLERQNVACVTPKPFCSLTETHYDVTRREKIAYQDPLIAEFARHFGRPSFEISEMPPAAVPPSRLSAWWVFRRMRRNRKGACFTTITPAWRVWASTSISAIR